MGHVIYDLLQLLVIYAFGRHICYPAARWALTLGEPAPPWTTACTLCAKRTTTPAFYRDEAYCPPCTLVALSVSPTKPGPINGCNHPGDQ